TVNPKGKQYFGRDRFSYDRESDSWRCPAGETLSLYKTSHAQKKKEYTTAACRTCPLRSQCTKAKQRVIVRDFYEDDRAAMHQRAMADPVWMKLRREMAEHPFGTMKWLMGHPRFLVRGLKKAKAELGLTVLSYNLKRAISILKVPELLRALQPSPGRQEPRYHSSREQRVRCHKLRVFARPVPRGRTELGGDQSAVHLALPPRHVQGCPPNIRLDLPCRLIRAASADEIISARLARQDEVIDRKALVAFAAFREHSRH